MMREQLSRLGLGLFRRRWLVLGVWLLLLGLCVLQLRLNPKPLVQTESTGATHSQAYRVMTVLRDEFGYRQGNTLALVYRSKPGLEATGEHLRKRLLEVFPQHIAAIHSFQGKRDPQLRILLFSFRDGMQFIEGQELAQKARLLVDGWEQEHRMQTWMTGNLAFFADIVAESEQYISSAEVFALSVAYLILLFSFGGVFASFLPIVMGATTIVFLQGLLRLLGLDTTPMADILCSLLGLALAIDYSLFTVSRFQEEQSQGASVPEALQTTLKYAGKTILVSAAIVLASIVVLLIPEVTGMRIMARNLLLVVVLSVINSVLVLPALLALSQRILAWPRGLTRRIQGIDRYGPWKRFTRHITAYPLRYFALSLALLLALSAPVLTMRLWDPVQTLASKQSESMQGYELLRADGWGGQMLPIHVVVRSRDGSPIDSDAGLGYIYDLSSSLSAHPDVAGVQSLTSLSQGSDKQAAIGFYRQMQMLGGLLPLSPDPDQTVLMPLINEAGGRNAHLISVFPADIMDLQSSHRIVAHVTAFAQAHPGFEVMAGGVVVRAKDFSDELYRQMPLMVGIVLASIFVLLFFYMRALVLPIKAAIMNFVPIFGSFGILTLIYQHGWFSSLLGTPVNGAVTSVIPITLFCIVFGLSMDYEVLILSRISEAYEQGGEVREAVIEGMARSGAVISGAALIFLSVFMPSVFSTSPAVKELGIGILSAVIIDATLVRLLLVPSFMMLLGKWNWWTPYWPFRNR